MLARRMGSKAALLRGNGRAGSALCPELIEKFAFEDAQIERLVIGLHHTRGHWHVNVTVEVDSAGSTGGNL
jgi:hypothetical protein